MNELNTAEWFFIQTFIFTLLTTLFLFYLLSKKTNEVNSLKKKLNEKFENRTPRFLARELDNSSLALEKKQKNKKRSLSVLKALSLRKNILDIEIACLNEEGNNNSNIDAIIEKLVHYINRTPWLSPNQKKKLPEKLIENSIESIDNNKSHLSELIEIQKETIIDLKNKLEKANLDSNFPEQLNNEENSRSINNLETHLTKGRTNYLELKQRFEKLTSFNPEENNLKNINEANVMADEILLDVHNQYSSALTNLEKIRQDNEQKREYLKEVENALKDNEDEDINETIRQLKLQLRDSEMCTAMLESESESLREEIESLRKSKISWQEKTSLIAESKLSKYQSAFDTIIEISSTTDPENLSKVLEKLCNSLPGKLSFLLETPKTTKLITNHEETIDNVNNILKSINLTKKSEWIKYNNGKILTLENVTCLSDIDSEEELESLARILQITSNHLQVQLSKPQENQEKLISFDLMDQSKDALISIAENNKILAENGKTTFESFVQDVHLFLDSLGLTERQRGLFSQIEQEFYSEMKAIFETREKVDAEFETLAKLFIDTTKNQLD